MSKPFYILSIDGGGIRGIVPAHILHKIETILDFNLLEMFEMIAGTSTGSIVAAAVATCKKMETILDLYKKHGCVIFKRKWTRKSGMLTSKYAFSKNIRA